MAVVAPVLFTLAAFAAVLTIWRGVCTALPSIRMLKSQLADASAERCITISTLDMRASADETAAEHRAVRLRGRRHPKPVTHRLHHIIKAAQAA